MVVGHPERAEEATSAALVAGSGLSLPVAARLGCVTSTHDSWLNAQASPGTGQPMHAVEHPADGTWSPVVSNEATLELCNGTLTVEAHGTANLHERRLRITDRLLGASVDLSWAQWEDLKEAIQDGGK